MPLLRHWMAVCVLTLYKAKGSTCLCPCLLTEYGDTRWGIIHSVCVFLMTRESDLVKDGVSSNPTAEEQDLMREEAQKMSSVLPTMWLGAQNGW